MSKLKVSVVSISYNQDKYIRESIESMLNQDTKFEYEIIIADDASTDQTQSIISEYQKKYPNILKPILRKKNIGVQRNLIDALKQATGDYIALCEGDDFWTDDKKLQKQVDFLTTNPGYSVCFHPVTVIYDNNAELSRVFPIEKVGFTIEKLVSSNYIQTNSVMYVKQKYDTIPENILPLDWYLHLFHAQFGKIGFIDRNMSSYRRHSGGIWWGSQEPDLLFWEKYAQFHLNLFEEIKKLYANQTDDIMSKIIHTESVFVSSIIRTCQQTSKGKDFIYKFAQYNADIFIALFISLFDTLHIERNDAQAFARLNYDKIQETKNEVDLKNHDYEEIMQELNTIRDSLLWRITKPLRIAANIVRHKPKN